METQLLDRTRGKVEGGGIETMITNRNKITRKMIQKKINQIKISETRTIMNKSKNKITNKITSKMNRTKTRNINNKIKDTIKNKTK